MKAILTYHSIDDSGSVISIDPETFRSHMQWLARSNVAVVPLAELAGLADGVAAIALTFDDGFSNFAKLAWPVLHEHAFPATVFVVSDLVGSTNSWSVGCAPRVPHLDLLGWSDLALLCAGGISIGSHTQTHPDLRTVSTQQLRDEIGGAARTIANEIGVKPTAFAYPYGAYDGTVMAAVAQVHALACTTELGGVTAAAGRLELPRLDAYYVRRRGTLDRFGSASFSRYLWLRARGRQLRQALRSSR